MLALLLLLMLSKNNINLIRLLKDKKNREQYKSFTAEGTKSVIELCQASKISGKRVFATSDWLGAHANFIKGKAEITIVSNKEMDKISTLKTNQSVLLMANIPEANINNTDLGKGLTLMIDTLQDPGNLGTIIRIADWYGIQNIICSLTCVDAYNSKTIQASMGSIARVNILYTNLEVFLVNNTLPVYGAVLNGQSIHQTKNILPAILLIGNEGNGISINLQKHISTSISIPRIGHAESLNAAVATAIICDRMLGL